MPDSLQARREALASALTLLEDQSEGIFGFPVCQDCGRVDFFQGMYGAMGSHRDTEWGKRFSAPRHNHQVSLDMAYCEVCCQEIAPARLRLCEDCQEAFRQYAPEREWPAMVDHLVRERPRFQGLIGEDFWEEIEELDRLRRRNEGNPRYRGDSRGYSE